MWTSVLIPHLDTYLTDEVLCIMSIIASLIHVLKFCFLQFSTSFSFY